MRPIPNEAPEFIKPEEALRLRAYLCPAGKWTIGWGHTGPDVVQGLRITTAQAEDFLREDMAEAAALVGKRIGMAVVEELTDCQYAALISFALNLGANPSWTIWKVLKARKFDEVPPQLSRFVYATDPNTGKKVKLAGLIKRRAGEVALWNRGQGATMRLPSSVTRSSPTPPTPTDSKPLGASKTFGAQGLTAVVSTGAVAATVKDQLEPYGYYSETLQRVVLVLVVIAALGTLATLYLQWRKKQQANR